jgi:riboflavin biosynthesis pyrimidine reductase
MRILAAAEDRIDSRALIHAHERLFDEFLVRYLDCEGGAVILGALHEAGILDEIFVTVTDVEIDPAEHTGIKRISALHAGTARLVAESRTRSDTGYRFQRWRFNDRS